MGASVVGGCGCVSNLSDSEHGFDPVALAVENGVMGDRNLAVGLLRDAESNATLNQSSTEPVGLVSPVS